MNQKKNIFLIILTVIIIFISFIYWRNQRIVKKVSAQIENNIYFVSTVGSDSNSGSETSPWRTIRHAANILRAGDTVYIKSGLYEERVSPVNSGSSSGGFINYVGYPGEAKPVMRGFDINSKNYLRISGFEITHTTVAYRWAITFSGTANHIEILDNYIHHIYGEGGAIRADAPASYITIRGNEVYYVGCVPGVWCMGNGWAVATGGEVSHWLIEYNNFHRCGDFVNIFGNHNIIRNNYLHDFRNSYWPDGYGDSLHADMFQPGSDGMHLGVRYHIYESNFAGDNVEINSHYFQIKDSIRDGDTDIMIRGNVGYNFGGGIGQYGGTDNGRYYNNTFYQFMTKYPVNGAGIWYSTEGTDGSIGNHNINNIYAEFPLGDVIIEVESGSNLVAANNLCYATANHSSCVTTGNPLFVNTDAHDFHIQASSAAISSGKPLTTVTSPSGSGSSFNVVEAGFFTDGYDIAEGDIIKVGSNNPARIIAITNNTITVDRSITWTAGSGVYWRNQDVNPDAGAFEYDPNGYNYDINISNPTNGAQVSGAVNITTNATLPDKIRQVIFYIDGIPVSTDFSSPFSYTWNTAGLSGSHRIEARAYPLYADTTLSKISVVNVIVGGSTVPTCSSQNGHICTTTQTCPGSWLAASNSSRCCSVTCATAPTCVDIDQDGYGNPASTACSHPELDCNDNNAAVHPGATEICSNSIDEDCSGSDLVCAACVNNQAIIARCLCDVTAQTLGHCCNNVWQIGTCHPTASQIKLIKEANKTSVKPGEEITYTIKYQNTSINEVRNVKIFDLISADTTYITGSATQGGVYLTSPDRIEWSFANLLSGTEGNLSFQVRVE